MVQSKPLEKFANARIFFKFPTGNETLDLYGNRIEETEIIELKCFFLQPAPTTYNPALSTQMEVAADALYIKDAWIVNFSESTLPPLSPKMKSIYAEYRGIKGRFTLESMLPYEFQIISNIVGIRIRGFFEINVPVDYEPT